MNESGNLRDATDQGQGPSFTPATPEQRRTHDDILRVLSDFQLGLESLKTLHAQRVELQERLRQKEAELAQRDAALEAQLAQAKQAQDEHAARERELASRLADREHTLADTQARAEQHLAETQTLRTSLGGVQSELGASREERAGAQQDLAREREAAAAARAEAEDLRTRVAALESGLSAARDDRAGLEKIVLELRAKLKADAADNDQRLAKAQAEREQALAAATAAAEDRVREMTSRVAQAQAEVTSLREKLERARPTAAQKSKAEQFVARRRHRLRLYRAALRERAARLRKGGEALAKRYEQVEQVLKQRAELAAIRDRVISADRALQNSRARGRAAVTSLAIIGTIAILSALSWAVSRQVAPAMFVGEVTLKADGRGRDLNPAELDEWLRFHQEALNDPRFQESAAERFARVGRADLGTGAAVAGLVASGVTTDSILPGEMKLQVKYMGKDQARRTTEVMGAALASFANAAQQRRIDGGATLIPNPASADDQPIDNTQTFYAVGILAAGMLVMSVIGTAIWRKLASVKSAFEQDATLATVLDEARWADAARP